MSLELPHPIFAYFEADLSDSASLARCFTESAKVTDEGNTYSGRDAIGRWKTTSSRKYNYAVAPFAIEDGRGKIAVRANVTGNFPGSPVTLRYVFVLDGDKIASLEIKP